MSATAAATLAAAIIGAGVAIIGSIIANIGAVGKLREFLSGAHTSRSLEHASLKEQQREMKDMLSFLKDEKNKELGRIEKQHGSKFDLDKIVSQLTALSIEVTELRNEKSELKAQNSALENENRELRNYISQSNAAAASENEEEWIM